MTANFFNSSDRGASCTLSNNLRTATNSAGSNAWHNARAFQPKSAGKWYFEVKMGANGGTVGNWLVGVSTIAGPLDNYLGVNNQSIGRSDDGRIISGNATLRSGHDAVSPNDVCCVAINLDVSPPTFFVKVNAGEWNSVAGRDPATNAGGVDMSNVTTQGPVHPMVALFYPGAQAVASFDSGDFTYAPPSGFSAWDATLADPSATAYRYARILYEATNGNSRGSCSEFSLRTAVSGANVATGGTPSQETTPFPAESADKALDGSTATVATFGSTGMPTWWRYDFGSGNDKLLAEWAITARTDAFNDAMPSVFRVMVSADGVHWVNRYRATGQTAWTSAQVRAFALGSITWPTVAPIEGTLFVKEAEDTWTFSGDVRIVGDFFVQETEDSASFDEAPVLSGDFFVQEDSDVATFFANEISGDLLVQEDGDVALFSNRRSPVMFTIN